MPFFFVMKKERVSAFEEEIFAYVTQLLFGSACLANLYLVVTHAGRLAKDVEMRAPWLKEQISASPAFASMVMVLGAEPERRIAFVENVDPDEAEDEEDRLLGDKKRQRALADMRGILAAHTAEPYRHDLMDRAGQLRSAHLEELKRELRSRIELEVRQELEKDRGDIDEERRRLQQEAQGHQQELQEKEAEMQRRFEEEWERMKGEFQSRAQESARNDLEPIAKDIIEQTEKKNQGRRCSIM